MALLEKLQGGFGGTGVIWILKYYRQGLDELADWIGLFQER